MAATSMKLEGKRSVMAERAIESDPSSSGWRSISRTSRGNSGNSSRKSMPLCARLASPGRGMPAPRPNRPASGRGGGGGGKLGNRVEEEHAVVRRAGLAGARHAGAAANQAGVGDGVVGGTEGALMEESGAGYDAELAETAMARFAGGTVGM